MADLDGHRSLCGQHDLHHQASTELNGDARRSTMDRDTRASAAHRWRLGLRLGDDCTSGSPEMLPQMRAKVTADMRRPVIRFGLQLAEMCAEMATKMITDVRTIFGCDSRAIAKQAA